MATSLTTGRPWRVILAFSIPLLLGNVVQQLYQFADAIVVGRHLGVTSLAAVGATGSLLFLLLGFAWGLTSGFAIPTYVLDTPYGKVPLPHAYGPGRDGDDFVAEAWDGRVWREPNPSGSGGPGDVE